MNKKRESHN